MHGIRVLDHPYGVELREPPDLALAALARRQYGVVARRQLVALGFGRRGIDRRRERGRLHRLHRGVYAGGIPVTAVPRTLLDLATTLSPTQLSRAFEEADRLGLIQRAALLDALDRNPGHHGAGRLASVVEDWLAPSAATKTELEKRFRQLCIEEGLPEPAMNVTVCGFEVDVFWPIVELDSYGFHGHRQAFERDRVRDAVLQLAGYRVIRITWRRLEREPKALARMLRALITSTPPP